MTIGTKIGGGFGLALLVLAAIGALSYWSLSRLIKNNAAVAHTHEVLVELETVLSLLKDAETGQRGYLLTGKPEYLQPYDKAKTKIDETIKHLRDLTSDNLNQKPRLNALESKREAKFNELQRTIDLRKQGEGQKGFEDALAVVNKGEGKEVMDQARSIVDEMKDEENSLLKQRGTAAETSGQATLLTIFLGIPLAL